MPVMADLLTPLDDILAFLRNTTNIPMDESGGRAFEARARDTINTALRESPRIEFSL